LGQESTYIGQGGGGKPQPGSLSSYRDDIPLRDQPNHVNDTETDHVYDAGNPQLGSKLDNGRNSSIQRRLGFGFFKKDVRIPWVVYIFTTIQVAVFIAEIIKNGEVTNPLHSERNR
jgi:hypothetical protein